MNWHDEARKLELCRRLLKERCLQPNRNPMDLSSCEASGYLQTCRLIDQAVDRYLSRLYRDRKILPVPNQAYKRCERNSSGDLLIEHKDKVRLGRHNSSLMSLIQPIVVEDYGEMHRRKHKKHRVCGSLS